MAANKTFLTVTLLSDVSKMQSGFRAARKSLRSFETDVKHSMRGINGAFASLGLGLGISSLISMARQADESRQSFAKLNSVANSMGIFGDATGKVVKRLNDYAEAQHIRMGVDDDVIRQVQTSLLTFQDIAKTADIAGGAFDRATNAAIDLAAAGFGTAESNAIQLGKALQDPLKGLTSMSRAGVTFTAQQKAQIKTLIASNKTLDAQNLILGAIEQQVKDTAKNSATGFEKVQLIFADLAETLGTYLLPYIDQFAEWLGSKEGQDFIQSMADNFLAIMNYVFNIVNWLSDNTWLVKTAIGLVAIVKIMQTLFTVSKAIYAVTKAIGISEFVIQAVKSFPLQAGIAAGLGMFTVASAAFAFLDNMMGGMPALTLPEVPTTRRDRVRDPRYFDPKTGSQKTVIKKTEDDIKKALETVQKQFTKVRDIITKTINTFRNAVELSFGLVQRGFGKIFRADRYVRELERMKKATADFQVNLETLRKIGGAKAVPLINQILGMSPEEGAAVMRGFIQSPEMFQQAIALTGNLANTGAGVGRTISAMSGNQTEQEMLSEIKLLRQELKTGKNTYNIKGTMTATEIIKAIRDWEKANRVRVLATA